MLKKISLGLLFFVLAFVVVVFVTSRTIPFPDHFPQSRIFTKGSKAEDFKGVDSVLIKATDMYNAGLWRRFLQGENYRNAWDAPIKVPVVWLDTLYGGLKTLKAGGGGQTHSLRLKDAHGQYYTLRTVCKDPARKIPQWAYDSKLSNIARDAISAGHPYAAIAVAPLADAVGIVNTHPRLVFIPEQPALDTFNATFGNQLFLLEYEPKGDLATWTGLEQVQGLMKSEDVSQQILSNPTHHAAAKAVLKYRLFDLTVGDWDRHKGNWGWVAHQEGESVVYTPIAADRDMAFYGINGLLPWLMNRPYGLSNFRPFEQKIDYLPGMMYNSRSLDPFFLSEFTREDFVATAKELQSQLTDEIIDSSIRVWPDTIFALNGKEVISHVKSHRDDLVEYANEFYELLAEQPQVLGTHCRDSFLITTSTKGQVTVTVFSWDIDEKLEQPHFSRTYLPQESTQLALFGLDGDDVFYFLNEPSIPVVISGGQGRDCVKENLGKGSKVIYLMPDADGMECPSDLSAGTLVVRPMIP